MEPLCEWERNCCGSVVALSVLTGLVQKSESHPAVLRQRAALAFGRSTICRSQAVHPRRVGHNMDTTLEILYQHVPGVLQNRVVCSKR